MSEQLADQSRSTCSVCEGERVVTGVLVPGAFTDDPSGQTKATVYCPNACHRGTVPAGPGPQADHLAAMPQAEPDAVMLRTLKQCEMALDALNGETGTKSRPCSFCRADVYDSQVGIVHHKDCPILAARAAIDQTEKGAIG